MLKNFVKKIGKSLLFTAFVLSSINLPMAQAELIVESPAENLTFMRDEYTADNGEKILFAMRSESNGAISYVADGDEVTLYKVNNGQRSLVPFNYTDLDLTMHSADVPNEAGDYVLSVSDPGGDFLSEWAFEVAPNPPTYFINTKNLTEGEDLFLTVQADNAGTGQKVNVDLPEGWRFLIFDPDNIAGNPNDALNVEITKLASKGKYKVDGADLEAQGVVANVDPYSVALYNGTNLVLPGDFFVNEEIDGNYSLDFNAAAYKGNSNATLTIKNSASESVALPNGFSFSTLKSGSSLPVAIDFTYNVSSQRYSFVTPEDVGVYTVRMQNGQSTYSEQFEVVESNYVTKFELSDNEVEVNEKFELNTYNGDNVLTDLGNDYQFRLQTTEGEINLNNVKKSQGKYEASINKNGVYVVKLYKDDVLVDQEAINVAEPEENPVEDLVPADVRVSSNLEADTDFTVSVYNDDNQKVDLRNNEYLTVSRDGQGLVASTETNLGFDSKTAKGTYRFDGLEEGAYRVRLMRINSNGSHVEVDMQRFTVAEETLPINFGGTECTDVADDFWAHDLIDELLADGEYPVKIVNGQIKCQPNTPLTRKEFTAWQLNVYYKDQMADLLEAAAQMDNPFRDLEESDPYYPYIMAAFELGIINGDTLADGTLAGTFRPNDVILRAELLKITIEAGNLFDPTSANVTELRVQNSQMRPENMFVDVSVNDVSQWWYGYLIYETNNDVIEGRQRVNSNGTISQVADMTDGVLFSEAAKIFKLNREL